jgi:hypothetical protein
MGSEWNSGAQAALTGGAQEAQRPWRRQKRILMMLQKRKTTTVCSVAVAMPSLGPLHVDPALLSSLFLFPAQIIVMNMIISMMY